MNVSLWMESSPGPLLPQTVCGVQTLQAPAPRTMFRFLEVTQVLLHSGEQVEDYDTS